MFIHRFFMCLSTPEINIVMIRSHPSVRAPISQTHAPAGSLNLPAFDDAEDVIRDLIVAIRPELLGTEQAVELREFLEHVIVATSPDQPMGAVAVYMIRHAVLSADASQLMTVGAP
jgi:hypothetical protein